MRVFHVAPDRFAELDGLPEQQPEGGFVWVGCARSEFEARQAEVQAALQRWCGAALVDLHVSDLLNAQLPSHYDYTSWYDLLVFRRLAPAAAAPAAARADTGHALVAARAALEGIDTSPVGFAVFDRVLLTVHPPDCAVREHFAQRLAALGAGSEGRGSARIPTTAADLMLRMVNHMVDGYLELRRLLTRHLGQLQHALLDPRSRFVDWRLLLEARAALHLLEDTCEDQRSAVQEWIDALDEWPDETEPERRRERELLRVRSRDVQEHVERVLAHVRRLEQSAGVAVQMHFSALGQRTNDIMRTLTVLTAVFLPLNLITGFFGMNFEFMPLIHTSIGLWVAVAVMALVALGLGWYFRRKRYLAATPP
ncbi:MAG: hypothetical protein AMXMBFR66_28620 [Pseudomonadota bacterium]|nr:magnesium transporter CorA family protein [Rubrivivax sp.]NLZ41189.1 magnesium transporter CorA family protein [Comamonadaceae bacterium]